MSEKCSLCGRTREFVESNIDVHLRHTMLCDGEWISTPPTPQKKKVKELESGKKKVEK